MDFAVHLTPLAVPRSRLDRVHLRAGDAFAFESLFCRFPMDLLDVLGRDK
jgi:hypothetical protein